MRPFLLSRLAVISFTTLSSNSKNNRSYFQLYFFGFAFLQFVLCQYVKDLFTYILNRIPQYKKLLDYFVQTFTSCNVSSCLFLSRSQ